MILPLYSFKEYLDTKKSRSLVDYHEERGQVCRIVEEVRRRGDDALRDFARKFDGADPVRLKVSEEEFTAAEKTVDPSLVRTVREAAANVERYHRRQLQQSWWDVQPGVIMGQRLMALRRVGAYVPGGTAAYPSSVLMTVIPARVAGVKDIILCTPPGAGGAVNSLTLLAAREAGASAVYKSGGAQAIAAMAYGTDTIPRVQKIVGPGNIYVTLAKREVFGTVGIDMLAGPSEIVIVADAGAVPEYIAADLLSQAEHDVLARSILITPSRSLAEKVNAGLAAQLKALARRETAEVSLKEQGAVIMVKSLEEACAAANEIAPEHLELHMEEPWQYLGRIENAGAVFVGPYTPEPLGDYWAGSNHVLPTGGTACYASALGTEDFMKRSHVIYYSREELEKSASRIEALAGAEGLDAHARAIMVRGEKSEQKGKS